MSDHLHEFDEALISGYIDGELTQQDEQRVRIHIEDCDRCRETAHELNTLKEATMTTDFHVDTQWDETPRSTASGFLRTFGWLMAVIWTVVVIGYGLWQFAKDTEDLLQVVMVFGLGLGFGLVFLSVLIDRVRTHKTDPYRKVKK